MSFIKLEPRCPKKSPTLPSVDPDPNWSFDGLLSELQQLESNLGLQSPSPLKKPPVQSPDLKDKAFSKTNKSFVMRVLDFDMNDDVDDSEDQSDDGSYDDSDMSSKGVRFSCVDFDFSDSEESEVDFDINISKQSLINKKSLEEGILLEFDREHQLKYKEQIRTTLSALEIHNQEYEMSEHSVHRIEKYIEDRREIDRQVDMQHQQKIAEVLSIHLSALQKDHKEKSQIEEQRLKDAAALEAERKKMALQEEKLRREKAEREEREKAAKLAEENRLAQEAAKKAAAEAAAQKESERAAAEAAIKADADLSRERHKESKDSECSGIEVMATDIALKMEEERLKVYNDVAKEIPNIPSKDLNKYGRRMFRVVSQITGSQTDVRDKSYEFIHILNDSVFTPSVRCLIFAQKVLSFCETPRADDDRVVFALARVIILVSSQVPTVMDFVLAEFYKACIYTVPKHLRPLNAAAKNNNYWKMVGYREENDKLESSDSYLKHIQVTMKLFAAMIQTEIQGIRNPYGLEQGWAWLAMFLNQITLLRASAFALDAFLRMAGYGLHRRYKSQFVKMLNIIWKSYLPALKKKDDPSISIVVKKIENYLEGRVYMKEPEELQESTASSQTTKNTPFRLIVSINRVNSHSSATAIC